MGYGEWLTQVSFYWGGEVPSTYVPMARTRFLKVAHLSIVKIYEPDENGLKSQFAR